MRSMLPSIRNYKQTLISLRVYLALFFSFFILSFVMLLYEYIFFAIVYLCCTAILFILLFIRFLCAFNHRHDSDQDYIIVYCCILYTCYFCYTACNCSVADVYLLNYLHEFLCFLILAVFSEYVFCFVCAVVNYKVIALLLRSALARFFVGRYLVYYLLIYCIYCVLRIIFSIQCTRAYLGRRFVECFVFTDGS